MKAANKRHIIITGSRGSGKTTLFRRLAGTHPGFTSQLIPKNRVVLHFRPAAGEEEAYTIGHYMPGEGTNRMAASLPELEALSKRLDAFQPDSPDAFFAADEIGYLEEASPAFCESLLRLFDRCPVIAVLRKQETVLSSGLLARKDILLIDLDKPFGDPGCVIMASGRGTRFGRNKLMTELKGQPLIRPVLTLAKALFPHSVTVTTHEEVRLYCESLQQAVIFHELPHRSDTARLGTEYLLARGAQPILFFQGDQPLVTEDSVMALLICAQNAPDRIIRLSFRGSDCAPVLFPPCFFPELLTLPEGKGGNYIAKLHPDRVLRVEASAESETLDIDTPEDLARLYS